MFRFAVMANVPVLHLGSTGSGRQSGTPVTVAGGPAITPDNAAIDFRPIVAVPLLSNYCIANHPGATLTACENNTSSMNRFPSVRYFH